MLPLSISQAAGGPFWIYVAVVAALAVHVGGGAVAILSGSAAMFVRKGGRAHRVAGGLFVAAMLIMSAMATFLAIRIQQRGNVAAGLFAFYLVATAWRAARNGSGKIGRFEIFALLGVLGIAAAAATFGLQARAAPHGRLDGYPPGPFFALAGLALLAAAWDLRMILRGGLTGRPRIVRHVGRMGIAFFAASSFLFIGQQKALPAAWHGSPILLVLGLAPLPLLLFWLVRVRYPKAFARLVMRAPPVVAAPPAEAFEDEEGRIAA